MKTSTGLPDLSPNTAEPIGNLDRVRLFAGALFAFFVFQTVGRWTQVPVTPHVSASLLQDGSIVGLIAVAVTFVLLTVVTTTFAGGFRFEAGLFCAAFGLIALPTQGGDIRNALLNADGNAAVYWLLATETVIFGAVVVGAYFVQSRFYRRVPASAPEADPDTMRDRIVVVITQAATTLVLLLLIVQSPLKGQALIGVGLAALLGSLMTQQTHRVRGSFWYVLGTLLAGVIAYGYAAFSGAPGAPIGEVRGFLAGPARVLPLHYASLGVAGAIYGYWISLIWLAQRADSTPAPAAAAA